MDMPYNYGPLYNTYSLMKSRCYNRKNPKYKNYGGRGIRVCERWLGRSIGYANFVADMGERPKGTSLDRIDNDGNYEPNNCRWTTNTVQSQNRRTRIDSRSKVRGVELRNDGTYVARITVNKKRLNLGTFRRLTDASRARLEAEGIYF